MAVNYNLPVPQASFSGAVKIGSRSPSRAQAALKACHSVAVIVVVRHRIVTAFGKRLAAQYAPQRQKKRPVRGQSLKALDRVFRAGRVKAALAAEYRRECVLVEAD